MKKLIIILLFIPIISIGQNFNTKFKTDSLEYRIDSINATIREMRDSIARQNIILMNQSTPTITSVTPSYTTNRTLTGANTNRSEYLGVVSSTPLF